MNLTTDIATLETRLDLVELFLNDSAALMSVVEALLDFPDIDKMLSGLTIILKTSTQRTARKGIDTIIYLRQTLLATQKLLQHLQKIHSTRSNPDEQYALIEVLISIYNHTELHDIQTIVDETITESTTYAKSAHEMRHQECFAIKAGRDGELDLARKTYLQTVEDIYKVLSSRMIALTF